MLKQNVAILDFSLFNDGFYAGKYLEGKAMIPPFFIQVKCSSYVVSEWRPRFESHS